MSYLKLNYKSVRVRMSELNGREYKNTIASACLEKTGVSLLNT